MNDVSRGILAGLIIGIVAVVAVFVTPQSVGLLSSVGLVIAPALVLGILMPRRHLRLVNILMPVVTSELILGGTGRWIEIGMLSGREILFVGVLGAWFVDCVVFLKGTLRGRFWLYAILLGFVVPIFWLLWSLNQGSLVGPALGDVSFFFVFLLYLPISTWVRDGPPMDWITGYVTGLLTTLSLLLILIPVYVWRSSLPPTVLQWFAGNATYFPNGFPRITVNADIFLPVAIWLGLFMWRWQLSSNAASGRSIRVPGFILFATSVVALTLTFSRALWLALVVVALVGYALGNTHWIRQRQARKLQAVVCIVALVVVALMANLSPSGLGRFKNILDSNESSNRIRLEQVVELVNAWKVSPILGNGFGHALPDGYVRSSAFPYLFEAEYAALLCKSGVIGVLTIISVPLAVFMLFAWAIHNLFRRRVSTFTPLFLSLAAGVLVASIAGAFNPYVTSAYFPFLTAFLLGLYDANPHE